MTIEVYLSLLLAQLEVMGNTTKTYAVSTNISKSNSFMNFLAIELFFKLLLNKGFSYFSQLKLCVLESFVLLPKELIRLINHASF